MKKILNFSLLVILISLISCATDGDEGNNQLARILKVDINGETVDLGDTSNEYAYAEATLLDDNRLLISGFTENVHLNLTLGETFINSPIQEGRYKIGATDDYLESNIMYFDSNDTNMNNTASAEWYSGVYGCNVLSHQIVGEIHIIKLDKENKVVSGTFNGTLFRWTDIANGSLKTIEITNGAFALPYNEETVELDPDRNIISAKVNGYQFMSNDPGSPTPFRSNSTGVDKIRIIGYDRNFGRMFISIPSWVQSDNTYSYRPDGSFQSLGVSFSNRINIPEDLLSNNPDQSNDSYISIINHDEEANVIEGTFYIENSEIEGRTIIDGYFKANYIDEIN